jgi:predicted DNA-binding transcriptional regulator YafY
LGFDIDAYVQDALMVMRGPRIEVELLFVKSAAAWIKDKVWHPSQKMTALKDGRLRMTLQVADNEELAGWILSFGGNVRVIRPEAVRLRVRGEAEKILGSKI